MSRTPLIIDIDKVTIAVLLMIGRHAGKACPGLSEIVACTQLPRRRPWKFMRELEDRGLIEMEVRCGDHARYGRHSRERRMRQQGGPWTGWTQRRLPKDEGQ